MTTTAQRPILQLTKTTPPTTLAVTVADAKRHLNIEVTESYYDSSIEGYLRAAQEYVEESTNLTLFDTNFTAKWSSFPEHSTDPIKLPAWPLSSIGSIEYRDELGTSVAIDENTEIQFSATSVPAIILPLPESEWPQTQCGRIDAVTVGFTAGYGATAAMIPHRVKQAIQLLVGHWFKHREAVVTGTISKEIEIAVQSLLNQIRVNEFVEFVKQ